MRPLRGLTELGNYNRGWRYCFLCQTEDHYDIEDVGEITEDHYDIEDVEEIKYSSIELFKYKSELFEDLMKCVKIKSDIAKCWGEEFEYKWWDNSERTCSSCYLSEVNEF